VRHERRIGVLVFAAALAAILVMLYPLGSGLTADQVETEVLDEALER
jgi:hypothetical protein